MMVLQHVNFVAELDADLYRGSHMWRPVYARRIFGGQLVGQALEAATRTVASTLTVHSLHTYFVRSGDWALPVIYRVLRLRDGQSFATRSVLASQRGRPIAVVLASFHKHEPSSFEHQQPMPDVPDPETVSDSRDQFFVRVRDKMQANEDSDKDGMADGKVAVEVPIVCKECPMPRQEGKKEARLTSCYTTIVALINEVACNCVLHCSRMLLWMKTRDPLPSNRTSLHLCLISYMSDLRMLSTALIPHYQSFKPGMMTSLDHTMWFHSPVRADEWLLYELYSPKAANNRALVTGR